MTPHGYASPYIRLFYNGEELSVNVTRFRYVYDEEEEDEIEIKIEVENPSDADSPAYQEDAMLVVSWGYIGESEIVNRKIWIRDPTWEFGKEVIKGTLIATEKGSDIKSISSKKIYKNKSLPQVVNDVAKVTGLKAYYERLENPEQTTVKLTPIFNETLSQYLIRENKAIAEMELKRKNDLAKNNPALNKQLIEKILKENPKSPDKNDTRFKYPASGVLPGNSQEAKDNNSAGFQVYQNIPQANRSSKQILKSLANREPDGPYIVETRDDEIILKKRDFNKKPYKTYRYGDTNGDLIEFNPSVKKRLRKGSSTASEFGGWNAEDKTTYTGEVNSADGSPSLAKAMELLANYRRVQKLGGGNLIAFEKADNRQLFIGRENVLAKIDNSGVYTRGQINTVKVTVDDAEKILSKAVDDFNNRKNEKIKQVYNSLGLAAPESYDQAANNRRASELKKNRISASIVGDPSITTGMIITIVNVSEKYNGNYYIIKAEHEIARGEPYTVQLELTRQGHNLKINENYKTAKELGRKVNSNAGPDVTSGSIPSKVIEKKNNPY